MPQDSPATAAGTDGLQELIAELKRVPPTLVYAEIAIGEACLRAVRALKWFIVPDTWAPVNRRHMRDDVDRFRNERLQPPTSLRAALEQATLAVEYYEHAQEVATRTAAALAQLDTEGDRLREQWTRVLMGEACGLSLEDRESGAGGAVAKSRTAAKEMVDTIPALVAHLDDRAKLATKKAEAEKELGIARRRHATLITFAHAFTFATPDALADLSTVAAANSAAVPDVQAGDGETATMAESRQ